MKNIIVLIDNALEIFFTQENTLTFLSDSYTKINFERPKKEWYSETHIKESPYINIYLFDIQEAKELNRFDYATQSIKNSTIIEEKENPYVHLFYIVTVYGKKIIDQKESIAEQEHQLLGELFKTALSYGHIPKKYIYDGSFQLSLPKIRMELIQTKLLESDISSNIWSALDQYLKPALYLKVTVPIHIDKTIESAMVVSKMIQIGTPASKHYYTISLQPSIRNIYPSTEPIEISKCNLILDELITNKEFIQNKVTEITIYENNNLHIDDTLIIMDEYQSEFITINAIVQSNPQTTLTLKNETLYSHKIGTELRKIDINNRQVLKNIHFISAPDKDRNKLKIFGDDIKNLQNNDLIYLKNNHDEIEYFQIIKKSELNINILNQLFQIGGIVTKDKKTMIPIKDAKVTLKETETKIEMKVTNVNGQFTFNNLNTNLNYIINIEADGYKNKEIKLDEKPLAITKMIIELEKN